MPPMRPALQAVVDAYTAIAAQDFAVASGKTESYRSIKPKHGPRGVHYEFVAAARTGPVTAEVHVETSGLAGVLGVFEKVASELKLEGFSVAVDPTWKKVGCRVVVHAASDTPVDVATAMKRLIEASYEPIREWVSQRAGAAPNAAGLTSTDSRGQPAPASSTIGRREHSATTPSNTILYGPPGTGKTYTTINKALSILAPELEPATNPNRAQLKQRFDELQAAKRIEFVTFHQSFSYEDFVEGLRAESDEATGKLRYRIEDGVFKQLCSRAAAGVGLVSANTGVRADPRIWKLSINGTGPSKVRDYCLKHGEARIGWGDSGDLGTVNVGDLELQI